MKTCFGNLDDEQFSSYLTRLHSMVHWLLVYKERNDAALDNYFDFLYTRISGLNSLLCNPPEIVELLVIIECVKNEYSKGDRCSFSAYKSLVFEAHSTIDRLGKRGDSNG